MSTPEVVRTAPRAMTGVNPPTLTRSLPPSRHCRRLTVKSMSHTAMSQALTLENSRQTVGGGESVPPGPVRYPNSPGRLIYVLTAVVLPTILLAAIPYYRIVHYWGLGGAAGIVILTVLALPALLSYTVFVSVEVEQGRVLFRGLLYKR